MTLSFIISGKEIDNSSIYSVSYTENGTEKPLVNGKVINGVRTRWALTDKVKIKILEGKDYKISKKRYTDQLEQMFITITNSEKITKTILFIYGLMNETHLSLTNISEQTLKPLNLPL